MKRKVVQIANFTKIISLPKEWTKKYNVKKGDELNVKDSGNRLIISSDANSHIEKINLDIKKGYEYNIRDIKAMYRCGYDEVIVNFDNIAIVNKIQHALSEQLLGFEIISQEENKCIIKDLANESDSDIEIILRRLFFLTLSMADESHDAVSKNDINRLNEIQAIERMNNKLCNLCERSLNKRGYKDYKKIFFVYSLIRELEQIADNYRDICNYLLKKKKINLTEDVLKIYKEVNDLFKEAHELYYNIDLAHLARHKNKRESVKNKAYTLFSQKKADDQIILHYLIVIIMKINHLEESII